MAVTWSERHEWLEPDGLGGFASGVVAGPRTRRYHALLLAGERPGGPRFALVNGLAATIETPAGTHALTAQRYAPDVLVHDAAVELVSFRHEPWPTWVWRLPDGTLVTHEVFVPRGLPAVALAWRRHGDRRAGDEPDRAPQPGPARLRVRPFLSGRDYHALQHENDAFRFAPAQRGGGPAGRRPAGPALEWQAYDGVPRVTMAATGRYEHAPDWYRHFVYAEERARGLDDAEDLAAPGVFHFDLAAGDAVLLMGAGAAGAAAVAGPDADPRETIETWRAAEAARRARLGGPLERAADAYIVRKGEAGRTIVAGYPWFTDWGRDTFIALRGLCLATGRVEDARAILLEWAGSVSEGMLPNRFPDGGAAAEYNAVDASLWYVVAAGEFLEAARPALEDRDTIRRAMAAIVRGYAHGTRHGIRLDGEGLLCAGEPGVQLTWMDARVDGRVITPRIGKPVEVQALWLNALAAVRGFVPEADGLFERGRAAFRARFRPLPGRGLPDVADDDGALGREDRALRPNQVFAVGGLPLALLEGEDARLVVDALERHLLTPLGLRSLAPGEPGYTAHYEGGVAQRDGGYHQGTVWPWLIGPFVEAWLRVHGDTPGRRAEARRRFVAPLRAHLEEAGLGHVSEIADAEPPFTPRGCPFQAWSVGELLRVERLLAAPVAVAP